MELQKKKVLFITNIYPTPKSIYMGIFVKEQIDCLVKDFGINAVTYFINATEKGNFEYIKSIFSIFNILRKDKEIKTIHIHYGLSALFLMFFRPKAKIFLTFHGGDILKGQGHYIQNFISEYVAKKVDKVFILNTEMEEIMKRLNVKYQILPCGVDSDFFTTDYVKEEKLKQERLILFPGDPLRKVKNYVLFKKVIDIIESKVNFKINDAYLHNMTRVQVRETLNNADCLLMTSISEGSPQAIKEALSCNLSVVSVPVGDVEVVIDGIPNCFVSNRHDPNELAALVILSLDGNGNSIREEFLKKGLYENKSICRTLFQNYTLS